MIQVSRELAAKHYAEHNGKPFFEGLINFITSGPVVAMVWEGNEIVATARKMMGKSRDGDGHDNAPTRCWCC